MKEQNRVWIVGLAKDPIEEASTTLSGQLLFLDYSIVLIVRTYFHS